MNESIIITRKIYNDIVPNSIMPTRLDSATCLYISIKYLNEEGILVYNTNPTTWNIWYPFFEMNHKFNIDEYKFKDNITYEELIKEYDGQFNVYEKNYSKEKRKSILLESFMKLYDIDSASIEIEIEPIYEIKYSKSKHVYTLYRIENYVLSKVANSIKLLNQNQYIQSIIPYEVNKEWKGIKLATNMSYLLENYNNIVILKDNKILISEK